MPWDSSDGKRDKAPNNIQRLYGNADVRLLLADSDWHDATLSGHPLAGGQKELNAYTQRRQRCTSPRDPLR